MVLKQQTMFCLFNHFLIETHTFTEKLEIELTAYFQWYEGFH